MAAGDVAQDSEGRRNLAPGEAITPTGRLSIARRVMPDRPPLPFSHAQLVHLDEALTLATRNTGLEFSIFLGSLGEQTRERAEELHANLGHRAREGVLIAVSPGQRVVEVVTGEEADRRITERGCKLAVMSMVASFKEDDLSGGLMSGLRMLADQAGAASEDSGSGQPVH